MRGRCSAPCVNSKSPIPYPAWATAKTHWLTCATPRSQSRGFILLDLNMPRMNGVEFLRVAKQDAEVKRIPIVVLTTTGEEQDRVESFQLGVAGYMIKPVDYRQFVDVMCAIDLYWILSQLP